MDTLDWDPEAVPVSKRPAAAAGLLLVLLYMTPAASCRAQSISVDTVPSYGTLGFITGSVSGADPETHQVAVYIHIEGSGWWSKPTTTSPSVPIDEGGGFSANVGTGGPGSLDSRAVIFCAALLPEADVPPVASGAVRIPASLQPLAIDCRERFGRTLAFAGHTWAVKEAPLPVDPGQNIFSDRTEDVFVDQDGLHLRVAFHEGVWWSTEVVLLTHFGYGTYSVQTSSELDDLDANITFGMFTWDSYGDEEAVPGAVNREIDFEDSRWTISSDLTNAQMVVQPYTTSDNLRRYTIPELSGDPALTRFFQWQPASIHFVALTGHHSPAAFAAPDVIDNYLYTHSPPSRYVPTAGREYFRLNLWINSQEVGGGGAALQPADGEEVEVVVTDVVYVPEPGVLLSQCAGVAGLALLALRRRLNSRPRSSKSSSLPTNGRLRIQPASLVHRMSR